MTEKQSFKQTLKKVWHFIWEEDSIWSWIVNIILAFILIKFIVYPVLGLLFATSHPIVAVVSSSMEHNNVAFEDWWDLNGNWYDNKNISKEDFKKYPFVNGFNKGDIMILKGKRPSEIKLGEVIVFRSGRPDPIIHRVVKKWEYNGKYYFQTKGDNNIDSIKSVYLDETNIPQDNIIGEAVFRVPLLGYVKIWFVELIQFFIK